MNKYKKLKHHTGIRKVLSSGNYEASKKIKGKTYSQTFKTIRQAQHWRNTYNPFLSFTPETNGMKFKELWEKYEEAYFPEIEKSSQGIKKQRIKVFKHHLDDISVYEVTPEYIDHIVKLEKKLAISNPNSKRCNFKSSLDEVKAAFNWYRENYDYQFHSPVLKRHYTIGIIRKTEKRERILTKDQVVRFFKAIDNPLFQDFAIIQFFCASRFGEVAGIQIKNIDFETDSLLIKEVVVEDQSKKFLELKPYPKNGHARVVAITSAIFKAAIQRRMADRVKGSNYLIHRNGNPMSYRSVQFQYNKALKKAGLHPEFSSTHILRYSMASESRRIMGSLDAAQAITGHKSIKMIEHYARVPTMLQGETISKVSFEIENTWKSIQKPN